MNGTITMKGRPSTNPRCNGKPLSFVRLYSRAARWRDVEPAKQTRSKAGRRAGFRESHNNMSLDGIQRRVNGNRLGHRRRMQMFREMLASL